MKPCVLVAVDDLFFVSKITETAKHLNIPLLFARSQDEVIARALTEKPALLIIDLNSTRCQPIETILKIKATMAGCDRVLPRSVFTTHLPEILAEYTADS